MTTSAISGRAVRLLAILALLLAACGGGDDAGGDSADDTGTTAPTASTQADSSDDEDTPDPADPTTTTVAADESGEGQPVSGESFATVTLGGETYVFAVVNEDGHCIPEDEGSPLTFSASLTPIDPNGEPIEVDLYAGEGLDINTSLTSTPSEFGIFGVLGGEPWSAGVPGFEEGTVDSYSIDGSHAEGSVTWVHHETGETAGGTFEVTCFEGAGAGGDFCSDVEASIVMQGGVEPTEQNLAQAISELDDLSSRAPEEVSSEVNTLYEMLALYDEIVSGYGYDVDAVPEEELQQVAPPLTAAAERLREYCELD